MKKAGEVGQNLTGRKNHIRKYSLIKSVSNL